MDIRLDPPFDFGAANEAAIAKIERELSYGSVVMAEDQRSILEQKLKNMVERWKDGTVVLIDRLKKYNDMMEGVTEEIDFPWPGASSVTMGVAVTQARTIASTFDRALFSGETWLAAENTAAVDPATMRKTEDCVNWLGAHENNMLEVLRDMPIPLFRDGTVAVMGEWLRKIEKAVDYKIYQTSEELTKDYPSAESAGITPKKFDDLLAYLDKTYNPDLKVQFSYDSVAYDAPLFTKIPLARFCFFPLSAEELSDCIVYGRQYFESIESAETNIEIGEYDKSQGKEAIASAKEIYDDDWGHARESIEGLAASGDNYKKLECYRLVLKMDMDKDGIPEKYLITYEHQSGRILKIRKYYLRKNIDCVVLFRFLKRDGRMLGTSLCGDGYDQFKMIDDFHRHRQNVRAITDAPAFLCPDRLKDSVDFGSQEYAWRPGVTIYLPDDLMAEGKAPRQMMVQNLDRTNNSIDEEASVMRYVEMRLGPSQGMSGKETLQDPRQPATKTIALLRQSTFRIDQYINEFKKSVPNLVELHNALYYQYGPRKIKYMARLQGNPFETEMANTLLATIGLSFTLKIGELALSPEFKMEKSQALLSAAVQFPLVAQLNPGALIEAWNDYVYAMRPISPERFLLTLPKPGQQLPQLMSQSPPVTPDVVAANLQRIKERNAD